jgi:hypothetical protein
MEQKFEIVMSWVVNAFEVYSTAVRMHIATQEAALLLPNAWAELFVN